MSVPFCTCATVSPSGESDVLSIYKHNSQRSIHLRGIVMQRFGRESGFLRDFGGRKPEEMSAEMAELHPKCNAFGALLDARHVGNLNTAKELSCVSLFHCSRLCWPCSRWAQ